MSPATWSAAISRLVLASGPGLAEGNLVAVSATDATHQSAGLLIRSSALSEDRRAVRVVPVAQLPAQTVAISDALAGDLGLRGDAPAWRLTQEHAVQPATMVLESMTEGRLNDLVRLLSEAPDLAGQVFWLTENGGAAWVHLEGIPFRVRSASGPSGDSLRGLVQIGASTQIELIAPGSRTGVDIVILADCSGSMSWADIKLHGAAARGQYLTRMDALKRALSQMIDIRAHTVGRVSRIALVSFTDSAQCVFPRHEGMAEISGMDDPRPIADFRAAVSLLRPQKAGTDIGHALHFASELLYRHGVPDNDRLIVLVSDGADWAPKEEDSAGEAVSAISDPVSLMEELERSMNIKLHAIGISDEDSFRIWWDTYQRAEAGDPHVSTIPNHRLITELVRVGGGDPRRVGGMEVLQEYFAGLGEGVTRNIGRPAAGVLRPLQKELITLSEPRRDEDQDLARRRAALADKAQQLRSFCVTLSVRCGAKPMYRKVHGDTDKLLRIGRAVRDEDEFRVWVADLYLMFHESLESRLLQASPDRPYDIQEVRKLIWDGRLDQVRRLRNHAEHVTQTSDEEMTVAKILMRFAGTKLIEPDDARRWTRLQVGLLDDLVGLLGDVRKVLEDLPVPARPESFRAVPFIDGYR